MDCSSISSGQAWDLEKHSTYTKANLVFPCALTARPRSELVQLTTYFNPNNVFLNLIKCFFCLHLTILWNVKPCVYDWLSPFLHVYFCHESKYWTNWTNINFMVKLQEMDTSSWNHEWWKILLKKTNKNKMTKVIWIHPFGNMDVSWRSIQ